MIIDERECATKFCPFGRGAVPVGDPQRPSFVGGVNFIPSTPITHCWGSRCMLWETHSEIESQDCHVCGKNPSKFCEACGGSGKTKEPYKIRMGYCGAGHKHE